MQVHRKSWHCLICDRELKTPEQLLRHVQKQHGETITEAQTTTFLRSCERPVHGISPTACPFCDDWKVSSTEVTQSNTDIVVTPAQFRRHLGKHLEQIALFALPRRHDGDDNSNEGDLDSNQALENSSSNDDSHLSIDEDVEELDLSQLRLLDVHRRIKLIRSRKRETFADTIASADSKLLNQLQLLWEQALVKRTSRHGPNHPYSVELIEDLATLYQVQQKWDLLVHLRRKTLRRVSKDENASVSQVTTDYDRTTAFVLLMKAYRDQGATVALENLTMNLMRQARDSQSYPTICNTAYILVDYDFLAEARELCTQAKDMMRDSNYVPELCVLAQLFARADMDSEAEQIGYRILINLKEKDVQLTDNESLDEILALTETFFQRRKPNIARLLIAAAVGVGDRGSNLVSKQNQGAVSSILAANGLGTDGSQGNPSTQQEDQANELPPEPGLRAVGASWVAHDLTLVALLMAIELGNLAEVKRIVGLGIDLNTTPVGAITPLCAAVSGGQVDVVTFLLDNGAEPMDDAHDGPLDRAVKAGSELIIRILFDHGVEISYGHALWTAVELDAQAIVKLLLDHSLSENGIPLYHAMQPTLLVASVTKDLVEMTVLLIQRGFSPKWCPAALLVAASKGYYDLASLLLANGAATSYRDHMAYTAISHAALAGQSRIVGLLLRYNASQYLAAEALIAAASVGEEDAFNVLWHHCQPEDIRSVGTGAVVAAAKVRHVGITRTLLRRRSLFERGPSKTLPAAAPKPLEYITPDFHPPVFNGVEAGKEYSITDACIIACSNGHVKLVKLLMEGGNRKPSEEEVHAAIQSRQCQMILHLFSMGAEASPEILQLALEESEAQMCQILLEKVTVGNKHRMKLDKCLGIAARKGDIVLAEKFLQKGRDIGIAEKLNVSSAICTAIENDQNSMAMFLIENQQSFTLEDPGVQRALSVAVDKSFMYIIAMFLSKGVKMDFTTTFTYDMLYKAHNNWDSELVETLLQGGEKDPGQRTSGREYAMQMALDYGHMELYQLLHAHIDRRLSNERVDRQGAYIWYEVFGTIQNIPYDNETKLLDLLNDSEVGKRILELNHTRHALLWSALITAPQSVVLKLISLGADVDLDGQHGKRPLHTAASMGYDTVVEALLEGGADPSLEDDKEMTPLDAAIASTSIPVVHSLINYGAIVDLQTMAKVIYKYEVPLVPLQQLVRRWVLSPVFRNIAWRLQDRAEVKVEMLRCIVQMNLAEWLNAYRKSGKSALDEPSRGLGMDRAVEQQLETQIYEQWLSTEDESGDNPFRKTLNRLFAEAGGSTVIDLSTSPLLRQDEEFPQSPQTEITEKTTSLTTSKEDKASRLETTGAGMATDSTYSEDAGSEPEHLGRNTGILRTYYGIDSPIEDVTSADEERPKAARLTSQQKSILEAAFQEEPKPTTEVKKSLVRQLDLPLERISVSPWHPKLLFIAFRDTKPLP